MNNINKLKVGDKFSTKSKLIRAFGLVPQTGKRNMECQLNEVERFLSYEKTGKINPKTHKPSNEIVITEKYAEPLEKVSVGRPQGAYDELTLAMLEWLRCHCCSNNLQTPKELLKDIGIVEDTQELSTYISMYDWFNMSSAEQIANKCKRKYIFELTNNFKKKVLSVLSYLKKEVPSLDWKRSYKITFDKERSVWQEATDEQIEIILAEIKSCQSMIEMKYHKKFNQIKFDEVAFDEYSEMLSDSLHSILGIHGHVWAVKFIANKELSERYNNPEYIDNLYDNVYPTIKGFYKGKMIDVIEKSGYVSKSTGQFTHTLAFSKEVMEFHKSIFGEYDFENEEFIEGIRRFRMKKELNKISKAEKDEVKNPFEKDKEVVAEEMPKVKQVYEWEIRLKPLLDELSELSDDDAIFNF